MKGLEKVVNAGKKLILAGGLIAAISPVFAEDKYVPTNMYVDPSSGQIMVKEQTTQGKDIFDNCNLAKEYSNDAFIAYQQKDLETAREHITNAFKRCKQERNRKDKNFLIKVYKETVKNSMTKNEGRMCYDDIKLLESAFDYVKLKNVFDWEYCAMLAQGIQTPEKAKIYFDRGMAINPEKTKGYLKPIISNSEKKKLFNM